MIHAITEPLKTAIATLDFYSGAEARLAGVVIPVTKTDKDGNRIVFPASCDVDGRACWEQGRYFDLLPNDLYKTVGYFEQRTDVRFTGYLDEKDRIMVYQTDIRFVSWLNMKKLGQSDCTITARVVLDVIRTLTATKGETSRNAGRLAVTDAAYTNAVIEVEPVRQVLQDRTIFNRYSYQRSGDEILYPWDYFAIDFLTTFLVGRECFDSVAAGAEIVC